MSFVLTYNGVTLQNLRLDEYAQEDIWDEAGQNTQGVRYTWGLSGVIGVADGTDLEATLANYRKKLEQPRKDLIVTVGGIVMHQFTQDLPAYNVPDANNGPKPESVNVVQIIGERAAYVNFRVVAEEVVTDSGDSTALTTHRFSTSSETDENGYTTRTVSGYARARDNKRNIDGQTPFLFDDQGNLTNPDYWRAEVTPPLPDGFRRESARYVVDPDGMNLAYQIVDKDYYRSFGPDATSGRGEYQLQYQDGGFWIKTITVELEAPKQVEKKEVLRGCMDVVNSRLQLENGDDFLRQISISEDVFNNRVTVSARAETLRSGNDQNAPAQFTPIDTFNTLFDDVTWSTGIPRADKFPELSPYGEALLMAVKPENFNNQTWSRSEAKAINRTMGAVVPPADPVLVGVVPGGWSDIYVQSFGGRQNVNAQEQYSAPYLLVMSSREYHEDLGVVQMSVAPVNDDNDFGIPTDQALTRFWQAREPTVRIIERGTSVRVGLPPVMIKPLPPVGAVVIRTDWIPGVPEQGSDPTQVTYRGSYEIEYVVSPSSAAKLAATEEVIGIDGDGYPMVDDQVQWRTQYEKLKLAYSPSIRDDVTWNDVREVQPQRIAE